MEASHSQLQQDTDSQDHVASQLTAQDDSSAHSAASQQVEDNNQDVNQDQYFDNDHVIMAYPCKAVYNTGDELAKLTENEFSKYITQADIDLLQYVNLINEKNSYFENIAKDFTCDMGKTVSKQERFEKSLSSNNLTYGEIEFTAVSQVFAYIKNKFNAFQQPGGVFVDIGSGTGKGILAGCLMHEFDKCVGVELLENLHNISLQIKDIYVYENEFQSKYESDQQAKNLFKYYKAPIYEAHREDLLQFDWWSDADFVLANSTCFEMSFMTLISEKTSLMKKGSWMKLPTSDPLITRDDEKRDWECLLSIKRNMSWGVATVHIHRKIK